ncbi:signal peptide peptidase SppA [Aliikangiella coralliicola]|uniref:Signal peptide peptidase SppA n=1 Tax=Aliikangiella coralliicola TaxID=2592383 RepID=A0A545UD31_9GAMM|nr:signal peptide peptidase SppA [Aliikangiella coralliicola]TQV87376.1 signal peptide peptidase SppA [Aliikangiella coralliicola]
MTKLIKNLWYGLDLTRKIILNLVFFLLLFWMIAMIASTGDKPSVEKGVALVLQPQGYIVEQLTYRDPIEVATQEATGREEPPETSLYDLIDAIENAKDDNRITTLVISTRYLWGSGVTKLQDLAVAIKDFKESGKKVIAYDDNYTQGQYYFASLADEVYMGHQGGVFLTGFSRIGTYFKSLLDLVGVNVHVFKVGTYKSAVEPYIRDNMSEEAKEANKAWLGDLWGDFTQNIATHRSLEVDDISAYINDYKESLSTYKGDSAKLALEKGFVDKLMSRIEFRDYMIDLVGKDDDLRSFKQISHKSYLKAIRGPFPYVNPRTDKVAVIIAKGTIVNGNQKEGSIGGDTVSNLIRKARLNDKVKAIVLRVDSGGGSAFASEIIREELVKAQQDGIKVVASMGDVAASGGYWISATADEIWARPSTITGSIGIFGMLPTFEKPLNKYGIFRDGVGTTKYSNPVDTGLPLSQDVADIIQTGIDAGYEKFLQIVGEGRGMSRDQVDAVAQGRVWSGAQAHKLGLVDQLGSLNDAVKSAAALAGIEKYDTWYVKRKLSEQERLLTELFGNGDAKEQLAGYVNAPKQPGLKSKMLEQINASLRELDIWNDPKHAYANCFCSFQ